MLYYIFDEDKTRLYDLTTNEERVKADYLSNPGKYTVMTDSEKVMLIIQEACGKKYCKRWKRMSKDRYYELLGCLPPMRLDNNGFIVSEAVTSNIYTICLRVDNKYYSACREVSKDYGLNEAYAELLKQLNL